MILSVGGSGIVGRVELRLAVLAAEGAVSAVLSQRLGAFSVFVRSPEEASLVVGQKVVFV